MRGSRVDPGDRELPGADLDLQDRSGDWGAHCTTLDLGLSGADFGFGDRHRCSCLIEARRHGPDGMPAAAQLLGADAQRVLDTLGELESLARIGKPHLGDPNARLGAA